MKTPTLILTLTAAVLATGTALQPVQADDEKADKPGMGKPYTGSAEFERLKSLAGTWEGVMEKGEQEMPITVEYRVVAGGSAIQERSFADTPMEMVTLYHDEKGTLAMTHFCMLHNRPHLRMTKSDEESISFELAEDAPGIEDIDEMHMHALTLIFKGDDELVQDWTVYADGKASGMSKPISLKRVKTEKLNR